MGATEQMLFMMLALSRKREYVTKTFTPADTSWTVPAGVILLPSIVGKGSDGYITAYDYTDPPTTTYTMDKVRMIYYADGSSYGPTLMEQVPCQATTPIPPDETVVIPGQRTTYYSYFRTATTTPGQRHTGYDSYNGVNTTGFGYTFPGGGGVAASVGTYANKEVVPGTVFPLSIPSGGYITITY